MGAEGKKEAGVFDYLKEAFLYRWNVLFLVGGAAAAALSQQPDVFLPIVGAVELAYLAGLTSIPRFRAAIDAKVHSANRDVAENQANKRAEVGLEKMLNQLSNQRHTRFALLKERCVDMRRLAKGVAGRHDGARDDLGTPALDRLLWVFLRLLFSQQALERFLDSTDEDRIKADLAKLEERKAKATERGDDRILRSLADSIASIEMRLQNYSKAEGNAEFVDVELDRIEHKIQAITEMAVSHEDPDYITSEVGSVAASMAQTESAIRELDHITGLHQDFDVAPTILDSDLEMVVE